MNALIALEFASGLDALPSRSNLDQDTLLTDPDRIIESNQLLSLGLGALLVERQTGINLGGDTTRNNGEDRLAELNKLGR